jgi:NAD(P)-dependent dehydrogenase (short-subunit alcohol dehydrogenase family)
MSRAMELSLAGKVALVTGASRGIGAAITSRKLDALEAVASTIEGETAVFAGNAGRPEDAQACVDATMERFGSVDILVNNAATNPYYGPTLGVAPAQFDKTFDVNLKGPLFFAVAVWNASMKTNPGVIINLASVGGLRTEAGLGVYNLTKAAIIHLTRQLAAELGPCRVVGIAPGLVKTDFAKVLIDNFGEKLVKQQPIKRLGEPQDIANLALFLASDAASWITGETFVIDGGSGVRGGVL